MAKCEAKADVTGSVWKLLVKLGDTVAEGDHLMILESMKMEIPVIALDGGRVVDLLVHEGQAVNEGQAVAIIES